MTATNDTERDERKARIQATVNDLQEIVARTLADLDSTIKVPRFRFYPEAQLFIVIGSQRAIDVAAKVIHSLPGQQWAADYNPFGGRIGGMQVILPDQPGASVSWGLPKRERAGATTSVPVIVSDPTKKP